MFCRYYQWWIENQMDDQGAVQSTRLLHHLEKCPRCRTYRQQLLRMQEQLQASQPRELDAAVLDRIQAAVRHGLSDESLRRVVMAGLPSQAPNRLPIRSIAAVLVIAATAGLWLAAHRPQTIDSISHLSMDSGRIRMQTALLLQSPERSIHGEIQNLNADIQRAVDFLQSCTPNNPSEPEEEN